MGNERHWAGCDDDGGDGIQAGLQRRADKWNPSAHSLGGYGALADGRLLAMGVGGRDEKLLGGLL